MDYIAWLEKWYSSVCNNEWEEYYGIKISTLDNPGWFVEIDILETNLEKRVFQEICIDNDEGDWMNCKIENGKFIGAGDPTKLSVIIDYFRNWVESNVLD